jgi:hypothetical protein
MARLAASAAILGHMRKTILVALGITTVANIIGGLGGLLAPDFVAQTLYGHDVSSDPLLLRFHLAFWLFVVALGVGYGVAARRLSHGHDEVAILVAGGLGKVAAAGLWIEMLVHGLATPMVLGAVTFDGSLGVLFLVRVLTLRR